MCSNNRYYKFGEWQRNTKEKHPLVFQCVVNVVSAILIAIIFWLWADRMWLWAKANVLYKTMVTTVKTTDNHSQVTIRNEGFMPSNDVYQVATGDLVEVKQPIIRLGTPFISSIEPITNNKYRVYLKDLPVNQKVILDLNTDEVSVSKE